MIDFGTSYHEFYSAKMLSKINLQTILSNNPLLNESEINHHKNTKNTFILKSKKSNMLVSG